MRAKFAIEVSRTIMKKAAPVATTGTQSPNNVAEPGLDTGAVTLVFGVCGTA